MELLDYNDFVVVEFVDEQQNDIVANSWLTVIDKVNVHLQFFLF